MHRAAFALRATGGFAVELGHERLRVHTDRDRVTVVAVRCDHVVVLAHQGAAADGDGFLADVEMEEPADLLGLVSAETALFEAANPHHLTEELDLLILRELRIDWRAAEVVRLGGALSRFFFGSSSR